MGYAEAIEQQLRTLRVWRGDVGLRAAGFFCKHYHVPTSSGTGEDLQRFVLSWMADAEPFSVTGPICDVLAATSATLPPYTLERASLPVSTGWAYFDHPLPVEGEAPLRAFLWAWDHWNTGEGLFVIPHVEDVTGEVGCPNAVGVWRWTDGEPWTTDDRDSSGYRVMRYCAAFLQFIGQRIAVSSVRAVTNRGARRRLLRDIPHEPLVRVIELRRRESTGHRGEAAEAVEWSCRWLVRGHWRNQYFPASARHKPVWINPHVKGPDDKPFKAPRATVYEVVR